MMRKRGRERKRRKVGRSSLAGPTLEIMDTRHASVSYIYGETKEEEGGCQLFHKFMELLIPIQPL